MKLMRMLLWGLAITAPSMVAQASACSGPKDVREATPAEIHAFFQARGQTVLSFFGYSGAGYEDPAAMLAAAGHALDQADPQRTLVNIGATLEGIGAVYELAKARGFTTTGIVSTEARDNHVALAPCVDHVFFVRDKSWGGFMAGTRQLSPTSTAMVDVSDVLVAIGGGEVARDELTVARGMGKTVEFIAADMDHAAAIGKAAKKGLPEPTDFGGAVRLMFER